MSTYFVGDVGLYQYFVAKCRQQWPLDVAQGDAAAAQADLGRLRRLGHNLKSVLQNVGAARPAKLAAEMERVAAEGRIDAASSCWVRLRGSLLALASPTARPSAPDG